MSSFLWYLLEANVIMLILFITFQLTKKNISFKAQRFFLISMPLFSYGIVLLKSFFISNVAVTFAVIELDPVVIGESATVAQSSWLSSLEVADFYWLGVIVVLAFSLYKVVRVFVTMMSKTTIKKDGFTIVEVDNQDSFSFFNYIQIRDDLEEDGKALVLEHEQLHAKKLHSADVLLLEIYQAASWFNPLFYFMKKEMNQLHEYEVDHIMYQRHRGEYMKFLLSYSLGINSPKYILTNQFYNSLTIKKRLEIMKTKSQKRWSSLIALPILMVGLSLISWTTIPAVDAARAFDQEKPKAAEVVDEPDQVPEYPGGETAMFKYIQETVVYPEKAQNENIQGIVYVQFVVQKNGSLTDVNIVKGVHEVLDRESKRVISGMPKWTPGQKDGKVVATRFTIPIHFKLKDEK